jgi:glycosyltransferase involved in cell wall biosynthesis
MRGGERQLLYLAGGLRATGHENIVCCRPGTRLEQAARAQAFEILTLPFSNELDVSTMRRVMKAARQRPSAIIHAHSGHTVGVAAFCRLAGGLPAIAHRRGAFALSAVSRWLKYGRVDRVVAVSAAIARLLEAGGLPREKIVLVPDFIPISPDEWRAVGASVPRFATPSAGARETARRAIATRHGINVNAAWVGNLAALVPIKDQATLVAAAQLVVAQRPDTVFLIGGEGPERDRLLADIERRQLRGRVVLLGYCDAAELLAAVDLVTLSSSQEGMGSTLLESAACGLPAVGTDVDGIPDFIADGVTGLLVPPRDPPALATALLRLLNDHALRNQMGRAAADDVLRFNLTKAVRQMEQVYRDVLS